MRLSRWTEYRPLPGRQAGFTLMELLIVVVVTATLLTLATPNLRGVLSRNQLLGQANEVASALALARSEAVSRGVQAGVCGSSNGTTCADGLTNWSNGHVLVFVDSNQNGSFDGDGSEPLDDRLLRSFNVVEGLVVIASVDEFMFRPAGFGVITNANMTVNVAFDDEDATEERLVTVQPSGIVTVTKPEQEEEEEV